MSIRLGNAPDSWGVWAADDPTQPTWDRFLDEVAAAGYRWIELGPPGYLPVDPGVLASELARRGLAPASGFVMFHLEHPFGEARRDEVDAVCRRLSAVGAEFLVLIDDCYRDLFSGEALAARTLEKAEWETLVETTNRVAELADWHGLRTVFHPHAESHVEHEPQIERLLGDTEIPLCFDFGHHAYCGGDAIAFLREHADRIEYLHLKNVDPDLVKRVHAEDMTFNGAVAAGVFVEPWRGLVDFGAVRAALDDVGYSGFAIVEQDLYGTSHDRALPIARETREYLEGLGFA